MKDGPKSEQGCDFKDMDVYIKINEVAVNGCVTLICSGCCKATQYHAFTFLCVAQFRTLRPAADPVRSTNIVASRRIGKLGGSELSGTGEMESEPMRC